MGWLGRWRTCTYIVELLWHRDAIDLNPQVDTLIKYLVDSLQSYETDYSDALCPTPTEADKSFMGDHLLVQPVTTNEFRMFSTTVFSMLQKATSNSFQVVPHPAMVPGPGDSVNSFAAPRMPTTLVNDQWIHIPNSQRVAPTEPMLNRDADPADSHLTPAEMDKTFSEATNLPLMDINIPDLPRSKGTWEQAIAQWFEIDPRTGVALKDWPEEWYKGSMRRKTGSKRSHRALVAEEYKRYVLSFGTVLH